MNEVWQKLTVGQRFGVVIFTILIGYVLFFREEPSIKQAPSLSFYKAQPTKQELNQINVDYKKVIEFCPNMIKYSSDIDSVIADRRIAYPFMEEERNWKDQSYFEVIINDRPKSIPKEYRASGHHCHIHVGIDGSYIRKGPCKQFCGRYENAPDFMAFNK